MLQESLYMHRYACSLCRWTIWLLIACTPEYKQSLLCEPRIRSGWFPGHQTPELIDKVVKTISRWKARAKLSRLTLFFTSHADDCCLASNSRCLRSQVSVLGRFWSPSCSWGVIFVTWLCLRFFQNAYLILELSLIAQAKFQSFQTFPEKMRRIVINH